MGLNSYFSNNAVIKHSSPFIIKGNVIKKTNILLVLENDDTKERFETKKEVNGNFSIDLGIFEPSKTTYNLCYFEDNLLITKIEGISFGEVILLAGQSNMAFSSYHLEDYEELVKTAKNLDIRYITLQDTIVRDNKIYRPSKKLEENSLSFWETMTSNPKFVYGIGLAMAIDIAKKLCYPVGLIQVAVGGCSIDSYLTIDKINSSKLVKTYLEKTDKLTSINDYDKESLVSYTTTSGIYNEKLAPLDKIAVSSVVWYQGENSVLNEESANYYYHALKLLVSEFRDLFFDDIKIIMVNITENFYPYAISQGVNLINEAICNVANEETNTYVITTYDNKVRWYTDTLKDDSNPIHPINKTYIGRRIALAYLDSINSPYISEIMRYKDGFLVKVLNVYEGLVSDKTIYGFQVASENNKYIKANAEIVDKDLIYVYSKYVSNPKNLIYGYYTYNYDANVKNSYQLPLQIYRSDKSNLGFFPNYAFQRLNDDLMYINYFSPILGESRDYSTYVLGTINNKQDLILKLTDNNLEIKHKNNLNKTTFFGPEFKFLVPNIDSNLNDYDYIDINIKVDNKVKFYGIVFENKGGRFLMTFNNDMLFNEIENDDKTFTIKIKEGYNSELSKVSFDKNILNEISNAQFLFSSELDGKIIIKEINIY